MHRFDTIADLTKPESLRNLTGPIVQINTEPFSAIGFSHSKFDRVEVLLQTGLTRKFVLKQTNIKADWLSHRTNDLVGREGALLNEKPLAKVWTKIHCPYVAFAQEAGFTGLLMDDFSDYLFPDVRNPLVETAEDIIVDAIASLHALFWNSPEIKKLSWLAGPSTYLWMLGPQDHPQDKYCAPPDRLLTAMTEGWKIALQRLPPVVRDYLTKPPNEIFEPWQDLPITLMHGDVKIANMAIIPGNKLVLFDWPAVGCAPCAIDLGWYLAVNASRVSSSKEKFIAKYKRCLEVHLQFNIENETWQRITQLAVITGAMMLLWNKAVAMQSGSQQASKEWEWWESHLEAAIKR